MNILIKLLLITISIKLHLISKVFFLNKIIIHLQNNNDKDVFCIVLIVNTKY